MLKQCIVAGIFFLMTSASFASYECVGEKFNFSVTPTSEENEYIGAITSKWNQLLLRVVMNEGEITAEDLKTFKTGFTGENSHERFTLYIGKGENNSYLNIERNLGGNSTYVLNCKKIKNL